MTPRAQPLDAAQLQAFGDELDAIRAQVIADLGERDLRYMRRVIRWQRGLEVAGRGLLWVGFLPPAWVAGVAALSASKILDNMEIGHNIMHGQYDWTRDPALSSRDFDWDNACPGDQWKHSHNVMHHTYTNVLGVDRDIGYGVLRMDPAQPWLPRYLGNPLWALLLALLFQYGVAVHDAELDRVIDRKKTLKDTLPVLKGIWKKTRRQWAKDYLLFPVLAGPSAPFTFAGNLTANLVRNVWAFTVIFCGHFPDGVETFEEGTLKNETRGAWYRRQLLGSANFEGSRFMHLMSGNLSHQIEHHLFPDLPAHRYSEIAPQVREVCRRYGQPYNTGSLRKQFGGVVKRICALALPPRSAMLPARA